MQETTHYVTYYVAPQQKGGLRPNFPLQEDRNLGMEPAQLQATQQFLSSRGATALIDTFVETPDSRRTSKWPELQRALSVCQSRNATLLIAELGTLTSNESFTQLLIASGVHFHCLDQPFVTQTILDALSKHAQVQRKQHGKLIREGLKMTSAKSGNPNAAEVINKVNKPKIDTAIVFALLLEPIIRDYRRKGYSQRQMVKTLNEEGFTAPEGGKWVLSQLQKVLDRVRLNEIASEVKPLLNEIQGNPNPELAVLEMLNAKGISAIKKGPWDEAQVKKLLDRIKQIDEIVLINRFVLNLLPLLHHYRDMGLAPVEILQEFQHSGLPIRDFSATVAI